MNTLYAGAGIIGLLVLVFFWADNNGYDRCVADVNEETSRLVEQAREEEQAKQERANEIAKRQYDEVVAINMRLDTDLKRLQHRESRRHLPKDSKAGCQGTSGAELSREDAEFLTREAARADRLRTALKACYDYADSLQN